MSNRKKVSFGSKNSVVEQTWIIEDADSSYKRHADVREIAGGMYDFDQAMTPPDDVMVTHSANHNLKNNHKHVTIGDSTFVVMGPGDNPVQPDTTVQQQNTDSNLHTSSGVPVPALNSSFIEHTTTNIHNYHGSQGHRILQSSTTVQANDLGREESLAVHRVGERRISRDPQEEYFNVLEPVGKDQTLESRDNPFLPGGDLSREAEDLLSRATIIRDNFYLNEEEKRTLREQQLLQDDPDQAQLTDELHQKQPRPTKHVQIVDHHDATNGHASPPGAATTPPDVEERISPQAVSTTAAAPPQNGGDAGHLPAKENGKAAGGDSSGPVSTDGVHVSIPDGEGQGSPPGDLQVQDSDKKRRNKCCTVM